ncbi:hypothetical protein PHOSAC3_120530 [Mesotoga infera]|nr:hypothetical protein PHOSAC3_120530 [Mesotoga infera]
MAASSSLVVPARESPEGLSIFFAYWKLQTILTLKMTSKFFRSIST